MPVKTISTPVGETWDPAHTYFGYSTAIFWILSVSHQHFCLFMLIISSSLISTLGGRVRCYRMRAPVRSADQ